MEREFAERFDRLAEHLEDRTGRKRRGLRGVRQVALELEELAQVRVHAQSRVLRRVPQVPLERQPPPFDELDIVHIFLSHLNLRHACSDTSTNMRMVFESQSTVHIPYAT